MKITLTGHREQRLELPRDVSSAEWEDIRNWIAGRVIDNYTPKDDCVAYCGMAEGSDMAFGYVISTLKDFGYNIKLVCVCPCKNYGRKAPNYNYDIKHADKIINLYSEYVRGCDDERDEYLAEHCDLMLAIFDGIKNSGVWKTIKRARRYLKKIIIYNPKDKSAYIDS